MQGLKYRQGAAEKKWWVVLQLRNQAKRFENGTKAVEQLAGFGFHRGLWQQWRKDVSGKLLGGLNRHMVVHISGELMPSLKEIGALWL
ncbi:hypothetical protein SUGI_0850130 [Cryptomeria japonica]|nr:hypothetical protein SUGI_0850130 [Cryptomeria japonica]